MIYTFLIVFVIFVLLIILIGKLSPYDGNITSFNFQDYNQETIFIPQDPQIIEKEIIKEIPIEKIVEKEIIKEIDNPQHLETIKQLEKELLELKSKPSEGKVYRNIGLELYLEKNLERFNLLLKEIIGKKVLIVTDSSFVLGANFSDHRVYEGSVVKYDIITDRYPNQPIVRFYVNVPVLSTTNVQLNWVFDNQKFDDDFSSPKLVSDYLKTKEPKNELILMEV
jgi:hypothetical protein